MKEKPLLWPLLRSYRWPCHSFIIYSLKQHGSHFLSWQEEKEMKKKLWSRDTENMEILLMLPNFYKPGQCAGSSLPLHCVRNNFVSVRKHVEKQEMLENAEKTGMWWGISNTFYYTCQLHWAWNSLSSLHYQVITLSRNITFTTLIIVILRVCTSKAWHVSETRD